MDGTTAEVPADAPRPAPPGAESGPQQPALPLRLDAKRASDRVLARIMHDGRIPAADAFVATVIATHVGGALRARLKRATIARWSHLSRRRVNDAVHRLEAQGVLVVTRGRTCCTYLFPPDWIARWTPEAARGREPKPESAPKFRWDTSSLQDGTLRPITVEPCRGTGSGSVSRDSEPRNVSIAAEVQPLKEADVAAVFEALPFCEDDDQQQQDERVTERLTERRSERLTERDGRRLSGILPGLRRALENHGLALQEFAVRQAIEDGTWTVEDVQAWKDRASGSRCTGGVDHGCEGCDDPEQADGRPGLGCVAPLPGRVRR